MPAPTDLPIVFHKTEHIPDRPGFSKNPGGQQFEAVRRQISQVCKKHNTAANTPYAVCDDQWGAETHYIHIEVSDLTREWITALVKKLQKLPRWAVGLGIPEGYITVYVDAIHVCGPAFVGATTIADVIARSRHVLRLDALVRKCSTDRDLEELAQTELRTRAIPLSLYDVTDAGLMHLAQLPRIQELTLGSKVTNRGLACLAPLTHLTTLWLRHTRISDLARLPPFRKLKELDLTASRITDEGLTALSLNPALEKLILDETKITSKALVHVAKLPRLRELGLRGCRLRDDGVSTLHGLPRLKELDLQGNPLTDQGAAHLKALRLHRLDLSKTKITDASVPHLIPLRRHLKELSLFDTRLSAAAIETLRAAMPNCNVISP